MANENFHTLVIANPQSAGGSLGRKWEQLSTMITDHYGSFAHRFTESAGDATRIAREALETGDYEMIVAMGGDGTISEVVDGFFTEAGPVRQETVFGVLPFGTGGDFRKTINVSKKLDEGAAQLRGKDTTEIDVGRLTYIDNQGIERIRHYVNIASFGISGLVDRYVNQSSKALGGALTFAICTVRASIKYNAQLARLRLDEQDPIEVTLQTVAVANGRYFGGGMQFAPGAKLDDGLFDVVTLAPMSFGKTLTDGLRVYKGTHVDLPEVTVRRAAKVVAEPVDPDEHILLDVDGETPGRLPATFELLPGALRLKRPIALTTN